MSRPFAEFLGTFVLVFAGTGAIIVNEATSGGVSHVGIALTFGLVVMALIYMLGDVSGCHINPAVTCGLVLSGRFAPLDAATYITAQLLGAFAASVSLWWLFPTSSGLGATLPAGSAGQSFVLETILTAILMIAVLAFARAPRDKQLLAGVAIGGIIGFEALFGGPISGASMNPARSIAPAVVSGQFDHLWVYIAGPLAGAAIGVVCDLLLTPTTTAATPAGETDV